MIINKVTRGRRLLRNVKYGSLQAARSFSSRVLGLMKKCLFEASILRLNQPLPKPSSWPVGWCIVGNQGTRLWQGRRICGVKIDDIQVQNCPPSPTVLLKCDAKSVETHLSRGGFHHEPRSIKKTKSCRHGNKPLRLLGGLCGGLLSSLSLRATSQKNLKSASACGDAILKSCHWGIRIS